MIERAAAVALLLAATTASKNGHPAQAATGPRGTAGPPSAVTTCTLRGVTEPRINADIEDAQGHVIARFSGAPTPLVASDFPSDAHGRVRVESGTGAGGFRIRGYLPVVDLPLFTAVDVPVVADHIWIASGRSVSYSASGPGRLRVEKRTELPLAQSFSTWAPCNALALAASPPPGWVPPGGARGYVLKKPSLDVFDQASGTLLLMLTRAKDGDGVLFFSSDHHGEWVNLVYHGEVLIDAWARARDLVALPPGESMDQLAPRTTQRGVARMAIQGEPRIVKPIREVPIRASAKETDPLIGVVEPGAETYVLDVVAGWASVMPKALNVVPGPDRQFWVKTADLGI